MDLWAVLGMKVTGAQLTVLDHVMTSMPNSEQAGLLGPTAWYELEQDAQGKLPEHKLELQRIVHRPEKSKTWHETPFAIRTWETKVSEYELLSGVTLDDVTRVNALLDILPVDLGKQARTQANLDQNYRDFRAYVLRQITMASNGRAASIRSESKASPGGTIPEVNWTGIEQENENCPSGHSHEDMECEEWPAYFVNPKGSGKGGKGGFPGNCYECGQVGHRAFECPRRQKGGNASKGKGKAKGGKGSYNSAGKGYGQ